MSDPQTRHTRAMADGRSGFKPFVKAPHRRRRRRAPRSRRLPWDATRPGCTAVKRQHAGHLTKGAHGHRAYCDLLDVPAARMRDRNVRVRRSDVASRDSRREERWRHRDRRRGVEPATDGRPRNRVAGGTRRLRSRGKAPGSDSTSTSFCCSTSTGSSAVPTASTFSRSRRSLTRPLVLTLHTVLSEPTDHQREVLTALCEEAERVIVMTETARGLLLRMDGCAPDKIRVVQHGAPAVLGRRSGNGLGAVTWPRSTPISFRPFHVRAHLPGKGHRDSDRGAAGNRRASSRSVVPHRRKNTSAGGAAARESSIGSSSSVARSTSASRTTSSSTIAFSPSTSWPTCCTPPMSS